MPRRVLRPPQAAVPLCVTSIILPAVLTPWLSLSNSRSTPSSRSLRLGRPSVTRTGVSPCLSSDSWSPATSVAAPFLTTVNQNGVPSPPSPAPSPPIVPQRYFSLTYCILHFSLNTSEVISCLPICFLSTIPNPSCHWNFGFSNAQILSVLLTVFPGRKRCWKRSKLTIRIGQWMDNEMYEGMEMLRSKYK